MSADSARPLRWRYEARAWRAAPLLTGRRVDLLLRWRSAAGLPLGRARFRAMGLADDAVAEILGRARSREGWVVAWIWGAQRFLGESRRLAELGRTRAAAEARRDAALAYHVAHFTATDPRQLRALRASAVTLFNQTMPILAPRMRRVEIPWRTARLPGLLARPRSVGGPAPLVVLLNGSSTAKEETIQWATAFLERGLAVLALDWPGTGEAAQTTPLTADCDDLTEGVLGLARDDSDLDDARVSLVGISLGGALAVRAAALDRRIAAVVAVTPPYDAPRWLPAASPLLRDHLVAGTGDPALIEAAAAAFALPTHLPRLRAPLLVFGAGRDLVVPPSEALRLAAAVGETATLVWFPRAGHALYEVLPQWTGDAATWISALLRPAGNASTQVDPIPAGADALEEAVLQPRPLESLT